MVRNWSDRHLIHMQGEIRCEQPNASLYTFTGNLMLSPPFAKEEQTVPLSQASLLLRGSSLRNTKYVFGTVIFAGHESKVSPPERCCFHICYACLLAGVDWAAV